MWHNATMYCESFHNSSHDCLLASTQCSTTCTLLARPCLPRLMPLQPIVNHPARLTIDRCLHHVATSTLLTNVAPSQSPRSSTPSRIVALPLPRRTKSAYNPQVASRTNVLPKCPVPATAQRNSRVCTHASIRCRTPPTLHATVD